MSQSSHHLDPDMLGRVRRGPRYEAPTLRRVPPEAPLYRAVPAWKRAVKRTMDILIATVALAAFAAILPLVALAIVLDSKGPIFYRQTRVGINRRAGERRQRTGHEASHDRRDGDRRKVVAEGNGFEILKLRTMYIDSETDGMRWARKGDPRITRVGRLLRLSRLDEVPQFWNVLRGEMSVVGPRPERPPFTTMLSREVPGYLERLRFKPGITGLAQVDNGYDEDLESVERKVEKDLQYITRFSLRRDLHILLRTFSVVLTGRGAC